MPGYTPTAWVDDDGSGTTGTLYNSTRMNNIENQLDLISDLFVAFKATLATDGILPGAPTLSNGVLSASGNAVLNVDGASAASGDLILVKDEVNQVRNGLYIVNNAGGAGAKFVLSRVPYQDVLGDIQASQLVNVDKGLANLDSLWGLSSEGAGGFTPDKTPMAYARVSVAPQVAPHHSVDWATTIALPANGRVGNTLTANANGALADDGHGAVVGERVLVKNETPTKHNGIYVVTKAGDASNKWVLDRARDLCATQDFISGFTVGVGFGTLNGKTIWQFGSASAFALNTSAVVFELRDVKDYVAWRTLWQDMISFRAGKVAGTYFAGAANAATADGQAANPFTIVKLNPANDAPAYGDKVPIYRLWAQYSSNDTAPQAGGGGITASLKSIKSLGGATDAGTIVTLGVSLIDVSLGGGTFKDTFVEGVGTLKNPAAGQAICACTLAGAQQVNSLMVVQFLVQVAYV